MLTRVRSMFSRNGSYKPLEAMVDGEWDLTTTLEAPGSEYLPTLINRLLFRLQESITRLATTTVDLSKTAPELSSVAHDLAGGANEQAGRAGHIAAFSREMADNVHDIAVMTQQAAVFTTEVSERMALLQENSRKLSEIVEMIAGIATQSKIVALNACVEAAHAGHSGSPFSVVAGEMKMLAERTQEATTRIDGILKGIGQSIEKTAASIGSAGDPANSDSLHRIVHKIAQAGAAQDEKVRSVSADIQGIAAISQQNSASASQLSGLGSKVRECCDDLITSVGVFRFSAHRAARRVVESVSVASEMLSMDRRQQEEFMRGLLAQYDFFELLYVTDAAGMQVTSNIGARDFTAVYGSSGIGKDWSGRPWFQGATQRNGIFISDVYRSVATGHFCFTISAPLKDSSAQTLGVLGADVNFSSLLATE